jgi:Putative peptidoglycan binding domain
MNLFKLSALTVAVASLAACQSVSSVGQSVGQTAGGIGQSVGQTAGGMGQSVGQAAGGMGQSAGQSTQNMGQMAQQNMGQMAQGTSQVEQQTSAAPVYAASTGLRTTTMEATAGADYPPARVGECYARVVSPAVTEARSEQVLVRASSSTESIVPAVYGSGEEKVLVRGESRMLEVVPATFDTVTERVLIKPAGTQLTIVPATFKTVSTRRLVKPAATAWKRSSELTIAERAMQNIDPNAGDVLCLIEIPAQYEDAMSQVVDQPALTQTIEIPAEYTTVTKTVQKTPPTTREVVIPAEYRMVATSKLVTPARSVKTEVPAEYRTVNNVVVVSPARNEWRQIVCETNATPARLGQIQAALTRAGFATGRVDGVIDSATLAAVRGYQKANGLPVDADRYINVATVKALGISEK